MGVVRRSRSAMGGAFAFSAGVAFAAALLGGPRTARADAAADFLRAATAFYDAGDPASALASCREGIALGGLDLATHAALQRYCGAAALLRKKTKEAALALRTAFALDPTVTAPPAGPPAVADAFERERAASKGRPALSFEHAPPRAEVGAVVGLDVKVAADDLGLVSSVRALWRAGGRTEYVATPPVARATAAASAHVELPPEATIPAAGGRVDYYLQALDARGSVVAEAGAAASPFALEVKPPPPPASGPVAAATTPPPDDDDDAPARRGTKGWVIWLGVGAGALFAGGAIVAAVLLVPARTATLDVTFGVAP